MRFHPSKTSQAVRYGFSAALLVAALIVPAYFVLAQQSPDSSGQTLLNQLDQTSPALGSSQNPGNSLLPPTTEDSQINTLETNVSITVSPSTPQPGDTVTLTAQNYLHPLDTADITWTLNGSVAEEGTGLTTFTFTMGSLGEKTTVTMNAVVDGLSMGKTLSWNPSVVDVIWEAHSTVPPFYRGKALPSTGTSVTFTALPTIIGATGAPIPSSSLIYSWTKDGLTLGSVSGYGMNTFTIPSQLFDHTATYNVQVSSLGSLQTGSGTVSEGSAAYDPNVAKPMVVLYEHSPTLGVEYEHALTGTVSLPEEQTELRAEPYFFSSEEFASNLDAFSWEFNGNATANLSPLAEEISFNQKGITSASTIEASVDGQGIFQHANATLNVSPLGQSQ